MLMAATLEVSTITVLVKVLTKLLNSFKLITLIYT